MRSCREGFAHGCERLDTTRYIRWTCLSAIGRRIQHSTLLEIASREHRVVVTKDDDFVQSHLISGKPERLLLVTTGNIGNAELERLLSANVVSIVNALESGNLVEIGPNVLTIHD